MKKESLLYCCAVMIAAFLTVTCAGAQTAEAASFTSSAEESIDYELYQLKDPDGRTCIGYYVKNNTGNAIYVGMIVECTDSSNAKVGSLSAFIPCIASGESTFIYVTDCYDTVDGHYTAIHFDGVSKYASAADDVYACLSISEGDNQLKFTTVNLTSNTIWFPQVTIVFLLDDEPVGINSGMMSEDGGLYLGTGSGGIVNIDTPLEYDDCYYYLTACYSN